MRRPSGEFVPHPRRALPIPTTFGGVAAVALGRGGWLIGWQIAVALLSAATVVAGVATTWGRSLRQAAEALPDRGEILNGALRWSDPAPRVLSRDPFFAVVIDPLGRQEGDLAADITLTLRDRQVAVGSILGALDVPYPTQGRIPLDRFGFTGIIEAWRVPCLVGGSVVVFAAVWILWELLGMVYGAILWAAHQLGIHRLSFQQGRSVSRAGLLPGAMLFTAAIGLYATRQLEFIGLIAAVPGHLIAGWVFVLGGARRACREAHRQNPFAPEPPREAPGPSITEPENPFRSPHAS